MFSCRPLIKSGNFQNFNPSSLRFLIYDCDRGKFTVGQDSTPSPLPLFFQFIGFLFLSFWKNGWEVGYYIHHCISNKVIYISNKQRKRDTCCNRNFTTLLQACERGQSKLSNGTEKRSCFTTMIFSQNKWPITFYSLILRMSEFKVSTCLSVSGTCPNFSVGSGRCHSDGRLPSRGARLHLHSGDLRSCVTVLFTVFISLLVNMSAEILPIKTM